MPPDADARPRCRRAEYGDRVVDQVADGGREQLAVAVHLGPASPPTTSVDRRARRRPAGSGRRPRRRPSSTSTSSGRASGVGDLQPGQLDDLVDQAASAASPRAASARRTGAPPRGRRRRPRPPRRAAPAPPTGVLSSWLTLATKSRRTSSSRRASVRSSASSSTCAGARAARPGRRTSEPAAAERPAGQLQLPSRISPSRRTARARSRSSACDELGPADQPEGVRGRAGLDARRRRCPATTRADRRTARTSSDAGAAARARRARRHGVLGALGRRGRRATATGAAGQPDDAGQSRRRASRPQLQGTQRRVPSSASEARPRGASPMFT